VKLATWNVNSIRARSQRVLEWFDTRSPDVACLQELKCQDHEFPLAELEARGYQAATFGQKSYNGVAIVARAGLGLAEVSRGLGDDSPTDTQARVIAATVGGLRVMSVYCPNGQSVGSEKYAYKLGWYRRLEALVKRELTSHAQLVVAGDYNVAPTDEDVHDPVRWAGQIHCSADERAALASLVDVGLVDVLRQLHPSGPYFTWWDYRMLSFPKGKGRRIDHLLCSPAAAARATAITVDRESRKGKQPSDHAAVILELAEPPLAV
jgi:exodeoxyribonuclease-3